jgi:hypothetical protein
MKPFGVTLISLSLFASAASQAQTGAAQAGGSPTASAQGSPKYVSFREGTRNSLPQRGHRRIKLRVPFARVSHHKWPVQRREQYALTRIQSMVAHGIRRNTEVNGVFLLVMRWGNAPLISTE